MTPRFEVAVACGDRRVVLEIVDGAVNVIEAPEGYEPVTGAGRDAVQVWLPRIPGATFEIRVDLHTKRPSS